MKNKSLLAILVAFVLIIGGWVFVKLNEDKSQNNEVVKQSTVEQQEESPMAQSTENEQKSASPESQQNSAEKGEYLDYNEQSFNESKNERLLFFYASWCPKCRTLDSDIKNNSVPSGKTIFKVDFDKSQELREKYGVTLQTTIVKVDENGNLVSKYVAYDDPTLNNVLNNL